MLKTMQICITITPPTVKEEKSIQNYSFKRLKTIQSLRGGWSGGAKVLGKLPVPGRPTILITLGQGPTALAVDAGVGCLDIFTLIYPFSPLSPSLWETARYILKYSLKGPLNPKQPTNQHQSLSLPRWTLSLARRSSSCLRFALRI